MFGLGVEELLVILVIVLVLFGGKKLPELSRSLGQSLKELRKGFTDPLTEETPPTKTAAKKTSSKKS